MSEFNIEVQGGSSVRLPTAGKYCEKDIIVIASGGGGNTEEIENIIDQSGVLESTDGTVTDKVEQLIEYAEVEKWLSNNNMSGIISDDTKLSLTYIPKTKMYSLRTSVANAFQNCKKLVAVYSLDIKSATSARAAFQTASALETVVLENTGNVTDFYRAFYRCENLKTLKTLNMSSATDVTDMFYACSKLETLLFVPETIPISIKIPSPVLTGESIQSIIDGLAYVETSQNLTLHRDIVLTDNQKQVINAKGWTLIQ